LPEINKTPKCFASTNLKYDDYGRAIETLSLLLEGSPVNIPDTWHRLEDLLTESGYLVDQEGHKVFSSFRNPGKRGGTILIKPNMVRAAAELPVKYSEHIVTDC